MKFYRVVYYVDDGVMGGKWRQRWHTVKRDAERQLNQKTREARKEYGPEPSLYQTDVPEKKIPLLAFLNSHCDIFV